MSSPKPITIIGGGLAGLTLGIGLRHRGVPVEIWEAGRYPRHRVCGEFICGAGAEVLRKLHLFDALLDAGARPARTMAIFSRRRGSTPLPLPRSALCISRLKLDALLADRFVQVGGNLRLNERWVGGDADGVVRASGRRPQSIVHGWRWFGLKAHARGVRLQADLEMHLSCDGYVGLCRLSDEEVNVCGLFRHRKTFPELARCWTDLLRGERGSRRRECLGAAAFVEGSFCSVSGLSLLPERATDCAECRIGDALTMTPPITGNGMSMAFESADLAMAPLRAFSLGQVSWAEAQITIARLCDGRFRARLAWAAPLQRMLFQGALHETIVFAAGRCPWLFRLIFARTR